MVNLKRIEDIIKDFFWNDYVISPVVSNEIIQFEKVEDKKLVVV